MKARIKPYKLREGDKVRIIAPSSPFDKALFMRGVGVLKSRGLRVSYRKDIFEKNDYTAGSSERRTREILEAFADKECRAVFCARGGFGSGKMLGRMDFGLINRNPKIFVGFSDITALHLAFNRYCGFITFHGPMIASHQFLDGGKSRDRYFLKGLFTAEKMTYEKIDGAVVLRGGKARGPLLGGNLTLIQTLAGTRYMPSFRGKILFIEDIDEAPYKIDRILCHLFELKVFDSIKGLIVGRFVDAGRRFSPKNQERLQEIIWRYFAHLKVPAVSNFPVGHGKENFLLPQGSNVVLDAGRKSLLCEASLRD